VLLLSTYRSFELFFGVNSIGESNFYSDTNRLSRRVLFMSLRRLWLLALATLLSMAASGVGDTEIPSYESTDLIVYADEQTDEGELINSLIAARANGTLVNYVLRWNEAHAQKLPMHRIPEDFLTNDKSPANTSPLNEQNLRLLKSWNWCIFHCSDDFTWQRQPCVINVHHHHFLWGGDDTRSGIIVCSPTAKPIPSPTLSPTPYPISNPTPWPIPNPTP